MLSQIIAVLTLAATVSGNGIPVQSNDTPATVGDLVVLHMTGDLATRYLGCFNNQSVVEQIHGVEIQTIGIIEQVLENGQVRLEHSSKIRNEGKPDGLLTLTAIVDRADITTTVTPKGTRIYASPDAGAIGGKSVETTADSRTRKLHLSGLKGVKLRTWTLSEEFGD